MTAPEKLSEAEIERQARSAVEDVVLRGRPEKMSRGDFIEYLCDVMGRLEDCLDAARAPDDSKQDETEAVLDQALEKMLELYPALDGMLTVYRYRQVTDGKLVYGLWSRLAGGVEPGLMLREAGRALEDDGPDQKLSDKFALWCAEQFAKHNGNRAYMECAMWLGREFMCPPPRAKDIGDAVQRGAK